MRTGKVLGGLVGAFIALVCLLLLAVKLLVDPNDYKPRIVTAVQQATGRKLVLEGELRLSLFPWLALELGPASLGNPPGFGADPFVTFTRASVRVRLLPLLARRLEIGPVEVEGLDLRLVRNLDGTGNWSGVGGSPAPATAAGSSADPARLERIEGIKLKNARVSYQDVTLSKLDLETGTLVDNGVVPVTLHVEFERRVVGGVPWSTAGSLQRSAPGGVQGSVDARFNISADAAAERYGVAALNLNTVVNLAGSLQPVRCSISAPGIDVNLKSQTLTVPAFGLNVAGAEVGGSVEATGILDSPALRGSMKLEPLVVREYLPRLGVRIPLTRDPKAFSLVAGAVNFAMSKDIARLEKLDITLDATHVSGNLALALGTRAVSFDLGADALAVDRYLPPPAPPEPRLNPGVGPPAATDERSKPFEVVGNFTLTRMQLAPLDLANVRLRVSAIDRVLRIFPLVAEVDGGRFSGDISLDRRGAVPVLSLDEHLSGIDMGNLKAGESRHLHLSGRGDLNLEASGRGAGADAIVRTLTGRFDASVVDGAVEGLDLGYELKRGEALLNRTGIQGAQDSGRTTFDAFRLSAAITNGVAETHDLVISSSALKVTGAGSVNLPAKSVDFSLLADTLRTVGNTPLRLPVRVSGPMGDPSVRPDLEALAKGQIKQRLEDVLKDKLQGLFGRP
jgi:AsmA protein